jgi:hypothetical protein
LRLRRLPLACASTALAGVLLACGCGAAFAQSGAGAPGAIYTCIDDKGRQIRRDRYIAECSDREQRILNKDGSLRQVIPPTFTAEERAEQEARQKRLDEERAALADAVRRDRNLKVRYPNEAAHQRAREAALDAVRKAIKNSELRLQELRLERKPLLEEAEFYRGKALPARLKQQLDGNEATAAAQREAMKNQDAELARVNRMFDQELEQLRRLWRGVSPGTVSVAGTPTPAPTR